RGDEMNAVSGSETKIFGGHNLKMGSEARFYLMKYLQPGYPQGHMSFSRATTNQDPFSSSSFQGNVLASMLIGWGCGGDYHLDPPSVCVLKDLVVNEQQDWKITARLTINLGRRYHFDLPIT